ncbi:ATP-binding protein [Haloimpatiens sp. FM7330]|uniref:HAMP domain-containing sensor histidine kinase n=1 Tax=Haloimpatiens sp. FM7330 TaxID=3298610 RepID=UPI00363262A4
MKKNRTYKKNKFYITLIKNYILFTISNIIIIVIILSFGLIKLIGLAGVFAENDYLNNQKSILKMGQYEKIDISSIQKEYGWIEIIDENYKVIFTKGHVMEKKSSYNKSELDAILYPDSIPYYVEKYEFKDKNGKKLIVLSKIPKKDTNQTTKYLKNSLNQMFIIFVLLYVVNILIFIIWLNKKVKKPLDKMNKAMTLFTETNEEIYIDYKGEAEFVKICSSFNHMVKKLKTIEKEKKLLEESKQKMLADISHDLKTPITTIQGYAKAITEGYVEDTKDINKYLNIIYKKSTKVTDLINLLFEYVKLNHPDLKLNLTLNDLGDFVKDIIAENYEHIEDKKFFIEFFIPDKKFPCNFDRNQLKRAISNLISNSLKYNEAGTTIKITLEENSNYMITVADNGKGIPDNIKSEIFTPFVTGDESRGSNAGTGLGLSITKKIIEKHYGEIHLKSFEDDEFITQFQIELPKPNN